VAQDLGYFKDENLEVELPRFEGGVGAFRSVASGSVDMAGTSSEPAIQAVAQGAEVKAIYTYAPNVDVSFVVGPSIQKLADLKGKKIGIQEPGGFTDVMSKIVLRKAGLAPSDVTFVSTTTAARVSALLQGNVDTGVLHIDQTLSIQKRSPGIHVLVNMWEVVSEYQYALYMVSADKLKNDAATLECMVRALIKADRAIYDPAMKQKVTDIMVKYTKADADVVTQTYDQLLKAKAWPQNQGIPKANVEGTIKSLRETNQLTKDVKFTDVVDLTIANKVVQQLGKKDFPY
jgi:ABC-type nitrate/sulfonate/bicarbonate transport system substrate-binding protein